MKKVLLLNGDYTPLRFISSVRALKLILKGRAEIIDIGNGQSVWNDDFFRTPSKEIKVPATVRLTSRIHAKWTPPRFRKRAVFHRDDWKCQYCHSELQKANTTIDHVHPKSKGGESSWKNCVTSCKRCNKIKANKTLAEVGWRLLKQPEEPNPFQLWNAAASGCWHDDWSVFLNRA